MQQLLRYGIVYSVALMIVLHPIISRAQSPQLQEAIESGEEALDTAEEIEAEVGFEIEAKVDAARASLDRLVEAERAGEDIQFAELQTGLVAIGEALNELSQIVGEDNGEPLSAISRCGRAIIAATVACVGAVGLCGLTSGIGCPIGAGVCGAAVDRALDRCSE